MATEAVVPDSPLSFRVEVHGDTTVVYCTGQLMAGMTVQLGHWF